jgi:hypothetical protein
VLSRRHAWPLIAALATTAATGLSGPPAALGGQWVQASCRNPDGSSAPSQSWAGFAQGPVANGSNASPACSASTPMVVGLQASPVGAGEFLQYRPPSGSTLVGGLLDVHLDPGAAVTNAVPVAALYEPQAVYDSTDVFYQCNRVAGCNAFSGQIGVPTGRGGTLTLGASCNGAAGYSCIQGVGVQLLWADLILQSNATPTASGFGGSLLSPNAHGTADLGFTASDPGGTGVYQIVVQVDGTTVYQGTPDANGGSCVSTGSFQGAWVFDDSSPCKTVEAIDLPVRTSALRDGAHQLKVMVTDAAQNTSTVLDQTIITANRTTVSSALDGALGAVGVAAAQYAFRLSPATAPLLRGLHRSWTGSQLILSGDVVTPSGAPAPGVTVFALSSSAGGPAALVAQTTSDGTGAFRLRVPRGPSRTLRLLAGAASVQIAESVSPTVTLHARALGAARVLFTGSVKISPLGDPRPLVFFEDKLPRGWTTTGPRVRVGPRGGFHVVVAESPLTEGNRYTFKAVSPATNLWAVGVSRPLSVRIK